MFQHYSIVTTHHHVSTWKTIVQYKGPPIPGTMNDKIIISSNHPSCISVIQDGLVLIPNTVAASELIIMEEVSPFCI